MELPWSIRRTGRWYWAIDRHMHFLLFGSALRKDNLESCKNWAISGLQSRPMLRPTLLYRGSSVVGWTHPVALASMLDDLDDRPIFIGNPFGGTITHHRMPPNTVVCRPPAWWLGGSKIGAGSTVRKLQVYIWSCQTTGII
jgi:hypothetical protein